MSQVDYANKNRSGTRSISVLYIFNNMNAMLYPINSGENIFILGNTE